MSQQPQLYIIQITETDGTVHQWRNQTKESVDQLKATIWRQGCLVRIDDNTRELISPHRLKEVFIIAQKGEVSGTMDNITSYGKS